MCVINGLVLRVILVLLKNLELLVERCRDPALSARRQAMLSLTTLLLEMPTEKTMQQYVTHRQLHGNIVT